MISSIEIDSFKALSGLKFKAAPLTVLTGGNSVGKSTLIQSILILRIAALRAKNKKSTVPLNGIFDLSLGTFGDVLTHNSRRGSAITIRIKCDGKSYKLKLTSKDDSSRYAEATFSPDVPKRLGAHKFGGFTYIGAERSGPRDFEMRSSVPPELIQIGSRGECVSDVLGMFERNSVLPTLEYPGAIKQKLLKQVEAWLSSLLTEIEVRTESSPEMGVVALRFKTKGLSAEWDRPSNTGFGVSYSLPIIVAGLTGPKGSLLLVDSPEAHLHSSAQSAIGAFIGRVAASGVQVFLETHSDHVLNGIRLAVAQKEHPLKRESVIIHHLFWKESKVLKNEITIDEFGGLSSWPNGFFDQTEKDLAAIVRVQIPARTVNRK